MTRRSRQINSAPIRALRQYLRVRKDNIDVSTLSRISMQLSLYIQAGLAAQTAIRNIQASSMKTRVFAFLEDTHAALRTGQSLAMAWKGRVPSLLWILVEAGEQSGALDEALSAYAQTIDSKRKRARQIVHSLSYPILLMLSTAAIFLLISTVVFPTFAKMYRSFHAQMPQSTLFLMHCMEQWPTLVLRAMALLTVVVLFVWISARSPRLRRKYSQIAPFQRLRQLNRTQIFCHLLWLMLHAGMPLIASLLALSQATGPKWLTRESQMIAERLSSGLPLQQAFTGNWHPILTTTLASAELTGDITTVMYRAHVFADESFRNRLDSIIRFLEPSLTVLMGFMVAATMLLLFVPMYQLLRTISFGQIG